MVDEIKCVIWQGNLIKRAWDRRGTMKEIKNTYKLLFKEQQLHLHVLM